jgi:hypothetical protein
MNKQGISHQTRRNWLIDAGLFTSAITAMLTGIYFLFLPVGGYQGGRNTLYGIVIFFERHTWEDLHLWSGTIMIIIAAIHLILHWSWVMNMARRMVKELRGQCGCMNSRGRWNLILNSVVGISFLLTALSGMYFLFFPGGHGATNPTLIFSQTTWDLIHTWSGVTLIIAAVLHFYIHWKWVTKVTKNMFSGRLGMPSSETANPQAI